MYLVELFSVAQDGGAGDGPERHNSKQTGGRGKRPKERIILIPYHPGTTCSNASELRA